MLDGNSQAWLFAVANANSTFSPGALLALSIPNNGQGAGTWTNISGLLGRNFWHPAADAAPIVAARSSAAGGKRPFVATALDGSTVAAVLWDGFNWQAAVQSLPMTVGLGSAIAISTTPADLLSDVNYKLYEFILVAGTNGHLYETRFLQNKKTNVYSLGAMIDLGVISATWSVDTWYDGLTASWYSKNGLDYQTVYARAKSSSGAIANYTTDISMTNVIQGWTNTTVATQNNWTAADSFVGAQMAVKYPVGFGWANDVGASCNNGNNIFCSLKSVLGQNAFSWTFPTMP